ncbi:MAG: hypothetical protein EOM37_08390 [Proteobacteria bacterium]|jgi:hypothetical protein|nr:hypothetical protein [Alphaproteobacteria bacterium]NCC04046.1 hypothetical protein [Pseudomonadota bacterium]
MKRLKNALEKLDTVISDLEDKVGIDNANRAESHKKFVEILKQSKARETGVLAVAQKLALRLDQTIGHVEKILSTKGDA